MVDTSETRVAEIRKLVVVPELITHHLKYRPNDPALSEYNSATQRWETLTFAQLYDRIVRWSKSFVAAGLKKGDRVAMLLPNSIEAVCFDQGAMLIGLVPVPLHIIDTPSNCAFVLKDSGTKFLVTMNHARWNAIKNASGASGLPDLQTVVYIEDEATDPGGSVRTYSLKPWLDKGESIKDLPPSPGPDDLACLIYTSGTTGKPKGVMLTHKNIISNVSNLLDNVASDPEDVWLSFLPLSHMFERTTSYNIGLGMGNHVYFSRGINRLIDDLKTVKPTIICTVPRLFEKVYAKIQERLRTKPAIAQFFFNEATEAGWRRFAADKKLEGEEKPRIRDTLLDPIYEKFVRKNIRDQIGGRVRAVVSGGAALNDKIARTFIGLGIPILQGYGLTETSPIISVNGLYKNNPYTVGWALPETEIKYGEKNELLVRGPQVMKGYWNRPADTAKVLDKDGWFATGDQVEILPGNFIKITGRIKEIIVTSNGEKVSPVDIEQAIEVDPLFAQVMILGEDRPFISAITVLNLQEWHRLAVSLNENPDDINAINSKVVRQAVLRRMKDAAKEAPQYGIPRAVYCTLDPWTIENDCLTPTLKLKRHILVAKYEKEINDMYANFGHKN